MNELRVYLVIRQDLALSRHALASLAARATFASLETSNLAGDPRFLDYDHGHQPKIAKRVKNIAQLHRVMDECVIAGVPCSMVEVLPCVPGAIGIGPVTRASLPAFVEKLQLLGDVAAMDVPDITPIAADATAVWLFVRADASIPYGKLAPQAGHGMWGAVSLSGNARIAAWKASGTPVVTSDVPDLSAMKAVHEAAARAGLDCSFIVDAGHTVFSCPTATVVGIGPCEVVDLPNEVVRYLNVPAPGPTWR